MTKTKNFNEIIHLQEQINNLEKNKGKFNKLFLNSLKEMERISHSVCNKINIDYETREKIFTKDLEFLSTNTYYIQDFTFKSFSTYENTIEFEYSLGNRKMMKNLKVSLKFFQMSDRDFATFIRKEIKKYKDRTREEENKQASSTLKKNQRMIEELQKENKELSKIIKQIESEQETKRTLIETKFAERIERDNKNGN